jgi:hypothetical protein
MKITLRILSLAAALLLPLAQSRATVGQVTSLNASTAKVIVVPGTYCKVIVIQNNGSNDVRLSIDGGTTYTDVTTGKTGSNPTTSTGILLKAGQQITITTIPTASGIHRPIVGIMATGTTTLDIVTDDSAGSNASTTYPNS